MKVLGLVPSQKGHSPGQRGSVELWESVLEPQGIHIDFLPFETDRLRRIIYTKGNQFSKVAETIKGYANRLKVFDRLDDYDAVLIYREAALLGPAFLEKRIAKKKPIIYQLDDPLFVPYRSPANGYLSYLKFFSKIKEIIRLSKVVIVNSTGIREYAEQFNKNIWQIPSVVDTSKFYPQQTLEFPDRVCVGWSGSPTTVNNIKMIKGALRTISDGNICDIHLIGGTDFDLPGVKFTSQRWNEATEVADLRKMQIGLVPLPDMPWNPYKFIMKTAQYLALGIVPVGTPMASNLEVIRHGENGFLAATDAEWAKYVEILVHDQDLRDRFSAVGVEDANAKYSLAANAPKIVEAFRAALN